MTRWTPEARERQSELIKKWKPWKHSTGAKSPEGKKKVSKNALKHGLCSKPIRTLEKMMVKNEKHRQEMLKIGLDIDDTNSIFDFFK